MQEIVGDLFESEKADAIVILTNGFINAQGANTMGAGCALKAKQMWPGIQMIAGRAIKNAGNNVHLLTTNEKTLHPGRPWTDEVLPYHLLSFPTKHHWGEDSDLKLLEQSLQQLVTLSSSWAGTGALAPAATPIP